MPGTNTRHEVRQWARGIRVLFATQNSGNVSGAEDCFLRMTSLTIFQ